MHRRRFPFLLLFAAVAVGNLQAEDGPYRYPVGETAGARLQYVNEVPVLVVEGTPDQIGARSAKLVGEAAKDLVDFPKKTLEARGLGERWEGVKTGMQVFKERIPESYMREIEAYSKATGIEVDRLVAGNVMPDCYRAFGCSSFIVSAEHSKTGGPLFGRNLDFFTLGTLHRYSMVSVVRPEGKHAFVSVAFPGLVGVLSGMNDAGLALAVHEVESTKDGAAKVNWFGVPYAMAFRRVLEECETVDEAKALLEKIPRTTLLNLAVCDLNTSGVIELTPKSVVLRREENGITICTNHFRTAELCTSKECRRFETLSQSNGEKFGVEGIEKQMQAVNQDEQTLQSMIFEPKARRLHVSLEGRPSSKGPYHTLDLADLLAPRER